MCLGSAVIAPTEPWHAVIFLPYDSESSTAFPDERWPPCWKGQVGMSDLRGGWSRQRRSPVRPAGDRPEAVEGKPLPVGRDIEGRVRAAIADLATRPR